MQMESETVKEFTAEEEAEMAARYEAWRAAEVKWQQTESQRPLRHREYFKVGEIAEAMARVQGGLEVNERNRRLIAIHLFECARRGEFDEPDVLMLVGQPELYAQFLPAFRALSDDEKVRRVINPNYGADRAALEALHNGFIQINILAIVVRRAALVRYLECCELDGAPRFLRELRAAKTAAASTAENHREDAANAGPPKDQSLDRQTSNRSLDPAIVLADWVFSMRGQLPSFKKLYDVARKDSRVGPFKKKDFLAAYQAVYETKPHRPPATGWPLRSPYREHAEAEKSSE
jgi:hypothetical protein